MFKKDKNIAGLETVIGLVTEALHEATPGTDEYNKILDQLDRLNKIASTRKSEPVSKNALIAVGGNLVGIVAILQHERLHVISSKAVAFVGKFKP